MIQLVGITPFTLADGSQVMVASLIGTDIHSSVKNTMFIVKNKINLYIKQIQKNPVVSFLQSVEDSTNNIIHNKKERKEAREKQKKYSKLERQQNAKEKRNRYLQNLQNRRSNSRC